MARFSLLILTLFALAGCGAPPRAPTRYAPSAGAAATPEAAVTPLAGAPAATPEVIIVLPTGVPADLLAAVVGVPFKVPLGGSFALGDTGLTVTFSAVAEDSRCPDGTRCLWQGRAVVSVEVLAGEAPVQTLTLAIPGDLTPDAPESLAVGPYTLRLVDLAPYPAAPNSAGGPHVATFVLEQR